MIETGTTGLKSHLAELLERVEAGEEVLVRRRGRAIARIVPEGRMSPADALAAMERVSARCTLGGLAWKQLRDEGRR